MQSAMKKGHWSTPGVFPAFKAMVQIGAGERGVVLNFGAVQEKVLDEDLHFRIPIMQRVIPMDVKVQKAMTDVAAASSDLQGVSSSVVLNYHIVLDYE